MARRGTRTARRRLTVTAALTMAALAAACVAGAGSAAAAGRHASARHVPKPAVQGWGTSGDGSLGNGKKSAFSDRPVKARLPTGTRVVSVRAGCNHSLAVTAAGHVLAWGENTLGTLGDGTTKNRYRPVLTKLPRGVKVTAVRGGCVSSIALTSAGRVLAWGENPAVLHDMASAISGQGGNGGFPRSLRPAYVRLPRGTKVKTITGGCNHYIVMTASGKLYGWGQNEDGELGDGTNRNRRTPVRVKLPKGTRATGVTAGCFHTLALTTTGLYAWGDNQFGQLGDGTDVSTNRPEKITFLRRGPLLGKITDLVAGCEHTVALFAKGAVLAWGGNLYGQLGNGTETGSDTPVGVSLPSGVKVKSISAGCYDSYALTTKGHVLAWGANYSGQLGDGTTSESDTPVAVGLPHTTRVAALGGGPGAGHVFVIDYPRS